MHWAVALGRHATTSRNALPMCGTPNWHLSPTCQLGPRSRKPSFDLLISHGVRVLPTPMIFTHLSKIAASRPAQVGEGG